jgi:hypothetical protein
LVSRLLTSLMLNVAIIPADVRGILDPDHYRSPNIVRPLRLQVGSL